MGNSVEKGRSCAAGNCQARAGRLRAAGVLAVVIVLLVRLSLSFALTFGIVAGVWWLVAGAGFDVRYAFALSVVAWVALRALEVVRMTMPQEYGRQRLFVQVIHWLAAGVFVLAVLALLEGIFGR